MSSFTAKVAALFDTTSTAEEGGKAYRIGGFHQVRIGEVYNGKYQVIRKLGFGQHSTVFLVRDQSNGEFWAMKVLTAEASSKDNVHELEILKRLRDADPFHPGFEYVTRLENHFEHEGPNGRHVCLILKIMGESLSSFQKQFPEGEIPRPLVQNFTHQLLQAVSYAHSCGIIHTDIQPENIMLYNPDETPLKSYLGSRYPDGVIPTSSEEKYQVLHSRGLQERYIGNRTGFNLMDLQVVLSDWGGASWTGKHLSELIQPVLLRAPEVLLEAPWGPAVDLWNLGALVPELIYAQTMFNGKDWRGYSVKFHLAEMNAMLGPFPRTLIDKSRLPEAAKLFSEVGDTVDYRLTNAVPLATRFKDLPNDERPLFEDFIRTLLDLDPENRRPADELTRHTWLSYAYKKGIKVARVVHRTYV